MDVPEISGDLPGNSGTRETRALGAGRRHVGRAGSEYAGRRMAGQAVADWQKILPRKIRRRRAHRLESRFFRLQLAAPANLQKIGRGLFRDAKDDVERHQSAAL